MPNPRSLDDGATYRRSEVSVLKDGRWDCNVCGIIGNWSTRSKCRNCSAYGPKGSGGGGKGGGGKGGSFGTGGGYRFGSQSASNDGASRQGGTAGWGSTSFAQRHIQRQAEDNRLLKQKEEATKREEALRTANQKLQRELAAAKASQKGREDDEEMEEDDDHDSEERRQERIEATQRAMPYLILQHGEESEQVQKARAEVEELQRASRGAKPYKTHRGQLERKLERLQRQQTKAKEEEDEALVEVERAQERLNKIRGAIKEREKSIAAVDDELKELLRKAIAEGDAGDQPPQQVAEDDPNKAWDTVSAALASMVSQPGVPPGWAEQMGALLEHVRVAALPIHQHAAPPTGTTSPTSTSSSSPSPPASSTSPAAASSPAAAPAAPPAATAAAAAASPPPATSTAANRWASRVQDLAFTEGGGDDGSQSKGPTGTTGTAGGAGATGQAGDDGDRGDQDEQTDSDSEDDMQSILGDLDKKENESTTQHGRRMAKLLRERATMRKEAKKKEAKGGNIRIQKEGKDNKDNIVSQKTK